MMVKQSQACVNAERTPRFHLCGGSFYLVYRISLSFCFNAATIWSSSQAVKAWDFDSLIVGSIPACSAKIVQKGGVDVFEAIDRIADLWTRALERAIETVQKIWDSILALFRTTDVHKKPVYPPVIGSWYGGYTPSLSYYTSGFL